MTPGATRILTTHTGSLPRPGQLTTLYARRARGETVDEVMLRQEARSAVRWVVEQQAAAGIDIVNDGEQQRESFVLYLRHRLTGLGGRGERLLQEDIDRYPEFKQALQESAPKRESVTNRDFLPEAVAEVTYTGTEAIEAECRDLREALDEASSPCTDRFMSAPSPGILAAIIRNAHYDTEERYLAALGEALRNEYEAILRNGFMLQLDCPDLALERHSSFRGRPLGEFLAFCEAVVSTINSAIAHLPRERIRLHVCWGNYEGPHDSDVPLSEVLPIVRQANVGGFVLPFANPRHAHEYRLFGKTPLDDDQILVAGVIDTLTNFVEHPEVVADRIERVAHAVGDPSRVQAGTDCGFDTAAGMGRVARDVVWAKLTALSEGARLASERLFAGAR